MPLTALDPNTALIAIDLQKGLVNGSFIHPIGEVIDRTRALIDVFRVKNLPLVLVNVAGRAHVRSEQGPRSSISFSEGWTDLLPAAGSTTERYRCHEAKPGRVRNDGS